MKLNQLIVVLIALGMMMHQVSCEQKETKAQEGGEEGMPSASDDEKKQNEFSEADKQSSSGSDDEQDNNNNNNNNNNQVAQDSDGEGSGSGSEEEEEDSGSDRGQQRRFQYKLKRPFNLQERRLHAIGYTKFLDAQQKVFWHEDQKTLEDAGLKDGMKVLDMGCGPGHLPARMMQWLPNIKITCVEKDPELATIARMKLKKFVQEGRFQVIEGSALDTDSLKQLEKESFDFVVIRLVLQHLPEPEKALNNAWGLLKDGGKICVFEGDEGLADWMSIDASALEDLYGMFEQLDAQVKMFESDPGMGKRVWDLLKTAKFGSVASRVESATTMTDVPNFTYKDFMPMVDTTLLQPLVSAGWVSQKRLNRVQQFVEQAVKDDELITCFLMAFWGEKKKQQ